MILTALDRLPAPHALKVAGHRYRRVAGKVLITNDAGHHALLSEEEYRRYLGGVEPGELLGERLQPLGFLREYLDFPRLGAAYARRGLPAWRGPERHLLHLARDGKRMTLDVLKRCLDRAFASPAPRLSVELAAEKAERLEGLVWFAAAYARRRAEWSRREAAVWLRCEAPPPAGLAAVLREQGVGLRRIVRVRGLPGRTKGRFSASRALCYVDASARNPAKWAEAWAREGFESVLLKPAPGAETGPGLARFAAFYAGALDRLLALAGGPREEWAAEALRCILAGAPSFNEDLDLLGGLAYGPDGKTSADAEGRERVLAQEGDLQPLCWQCAYKPYCRAGAGALCAAQMARFDALFERLAGPASRARLEAWI